LRRISKTPSIDVFPRHTLKDLWAPCGGMKLILASYDRLCLFGRDAIYWGLKCLDPKPGNCVWVPSFHCGVEVQAALDAGFHAEFYKIRPDLSIDEEDLENKLAKRPGPVILIHYFGFAQLKIKDIANLCDHHGVALIEDCSHALFSTLAGQSLGQFGHIASYSLYKTLGLCDGGALLINQARWQNFKDQFSMSPPPGRPSFHGYLIQLRALFKKMLGPEVSRKYQGIRRPDQNPSLDSSLDIEPSSARPQIIRPHDYRRGMSMLSQRLASTMNPTSIIQKRRKNWQYLEAQFSQFQGFHKVFKNLEEGVCPLYLPLWVSRRDMLYSKLSQQNIETFVFGRFGHPQMNRALFPETDVMRNQILCLPIHQYLRESELAHIVAVLGPLLDEHEMIGQNI
jgi:perosamine synthetase